MNAIAFQPMTPHTLQETGLAPGLVLDLVLKHAFYEGTVTLETLARRTKLSSSIIHPMYRHLQKEQLCDTRTMGAASAKGSAAPRHKGPK